MKKFEDTLLSGEYIVVKARLHWIVRLPLWIGIGSGVLLCILSFCTTPSDFLSGAFISLCFFALLVLSNTNVMILTNQRLCARTGLLNIKMMDAPLEKINSVKVESPMFGTFLDYANLKVSTSSEDFEMKTVDQGITMRAAVLEQIEIMKDEHIDTVAERNAQAIARAMK